MDNIHFLLIGGNGFIGKGLQHELSSRNILFSSIDIEDEDLQKSTNLLHKKLKTCTHILFLASKVGAKLFNTNAFSAYLCNIKIFLNVYDEIIRSSVEYNKKYNIVWFSTSEVYGQITKNTFITEQTNISVNTLKPRSLYATLKILGEEIFIANKDKFNSVTILRLFNVTGKNLKRGVVYDMILDCILNKYINYSADTTRTITDLQYACSNMIDIILDNKSIIIKNISQPKNSCMLKDLAETIVDILKNNKIINTNIKLIEHNCDENIQYRHTSNVFANKIKLSNQISQCVLDVYNTIIL